MKTIWFLGLMTALLTVSYNNVGNVARVNAEGPDPNMATPAPAKAEIDNKLPVGFSEYLFLHQTRAEDLSVPAVVVVKICSD
jgi:uncharacterized protein (DUF305 family)